VAKSSSTTGFVTASHSFTTQTGTVTVKENIMTPNSATNCAYFNVADANSGSQVHFAMWSGSFQYYEDSTGWHSIMAFTPGTWYAVKFVIQTASGHYDI